MGFRVKKAMAVPTIALYTSPPSTICSSPHPCQINSHASCDLEFTSRSLASSTATSSQKPMVGGLSSLFSSTAPRHPSSSSSISSGGDELGSFKHDKGEELKELSSSFRYSPSKFIGSFFNWDQSPVSVFQGPVSCGSSGVGSTARTPPLWTVRERSGDGCFPGRGSTNRLFNGFVRNALGSCVDYDLPRLEVSNDELDAGSCSSALFGDELTFNMEDNITEDNSESYEKDLLLSAQSKHKIFCDEFVIKAFFEVEKAHRGQMRVSGDPYFEHCVEAAVMLALVGANSTVVAAGLLHDTLDDSSVSRDYILETFGAEVADLVEGVSKLTHLSKLARDHDTADRVVEADRLHTMFLAMADARAVLIKLADRLHNMMTLDALPLIKQQRFAKETIEIFVPLANRLGIYSWKEQQENLCFKHLNLEQHEDLSSKLLGFI